MGVGGRGFTSPTIWGAPWADRLTEAREGDAQGTPVEVNNSIVPQLATSETRSFG